MEMIEKIIRFLRSPLGIGVLIVSAAFIITGAFLLLKEKPPLPPEPETAAVVNGEDILKKDWEQRVEAQRHLYTNVTPDPVMLEGLEKNELEFHIRLILLEQFLMERGRTVTDAEVDSYIKEITQEKYPDFEDYKSVLADVYQMTLDDVKLNFKEELLMAKIQGEQEKHLFGIWLNRASPLETEDVGDIGPNFSVVEEKLPEEEKPVYEKAQEILARARANEDFSALAQQFSEHVPSRDKGGDLGFISATFQPIMQGPSSLETSTIGPKSNVFPAPALLLVAFRELEEGESALYIYQTGFAIFNVTETRGEASLIGGMNFEEWYQNFRESADVEIFLP